MRSMAKRILLKDYLERDGVTQQSVATGAGITQGAVHQMIKKDRKVYVIENDDGSITLEEVRRIGSAA